jgi:gluconolactonase
VTWCGALPASFGSKRNGDSSAEGDRITGTYDPTMDGEIVATGLQFPEGPVWRDGAVDVVEIEAGIVTRWTPDGVKPVATTGGGPNGAALGRDGALYVTQNGGMRPAKGRVTPGIQRVTPDGAVEMVASMVDGRPLDGPNDLAFDDEGRLWFTDPRGAADPARNEEPGRIFMLDVTTGAGELAIELGPVFPNGIGFLADGTLVWTESFSRRVMVLADGKPAVLAELPEMHFPDGLCVDSNGRLLVATTYAHTVSVLDGDRIVDSLRCGDGMPTNCCFGGTDLYVTESRHGALWRFPVGVDGLALRS